MQQTKRPLVLLVESYVPFGGILSMQLADGGFLAHRVGCGQEALEKQSIWPFNLLVCNEQLPDMDGVDLCARTNLPAIALTHTSEKEHLKFLLRKGFSGCIRLPADAATLWLGVSHVLGLEPPRFPEGRHFAYHILCPDCKGSGRVDLLVSSLLCETCRQTGIVTCKAPPLFIPPPIAERPARTDSQ